jgi:hypothetical protein
MQKDDEGIMKVVSVDAGNGQVLYTSNDLTLHNGGISGGCPGGGAGWGGTHHHSFDMNSKNLATVRPLVEALAAFQEPQACNLSKYTTYFFYLHVLSLLTCCIFTNRPSYHAEFIMPWSDLKENHRN